MITFTIPGIPVAQPRQRTRVVGAHAKNYTPTRHPVNAFKAAAKIAARSAYSGAPLDCPVAVAVTFVFPRAASRIWKTKPMPRLWKTGKPDIENVFKSLADALTGILWRDDSLIVRMVVLKFEASGDEQAGTYVQVSEAK